MLLNKTNKIIAIGDSLTFGYGVSKNKTWVSLLNKNYNLNIVNKGVNGDTSTGILSRFFKDVLCNKPSICIIMCGTNDILCGRELSFIIDNLKIMVNDCLSNDITPIILSPPKTLEDLAINLWDSYINYSDVNIKLKLFSNSIEKFCQNNNIPFVNIYNLIPQSKTYYIDGIHLNELGSNLIFNEFKNILF